MLLRFSGRPSAAAGLAAAIEESKRLVPDHVALGLLESEPCAGPCSASSAGAENLPRRETSIVRGGFREPSTCWPWRRSARPSWPWPSRAAARTADDRSARVWLSISPAERRAAAWRGLAGVLGGRAVLSFPLPGRSQLVFFQERRGAGVDRRAPGRGHRPASAPGIHYPLGPGRE